MSFECNECNEVVSNSKMAGLAVSVLAKSLLDAKGISGAAALTKAFDKGEFSAGVLSNLVKCPKCGASNWS